MADWRTYGVLVTRLRQWYDPSCREIEIVTWGPECTARKLAPEWCSLDTTWGTAYRNGERMPKDDVDKLLAVGDHVVFTIRPGLEPVTLTLVGTSLSATLPGVVAAGVLLAQGILISFAIQALLGPSKKPGEPGDESSSNFLLGVQSNADLAGAPVPVVYGRHRVVPFRINRYTRNQLDSNGDPVSEYFALFLLCDGLVHAIGDKLTSGGPYSVAQGNALQTLQINSQPAENFVGVESWVRMGNVDQDPIPGLAQPVIQDTVGSVLTESPTVTAGGTVEATAGTFSAAHSNITLWDSEVSYTMGDDADQFTGVVTFARGLVRFDSSGNAANNQCRVQFRYRQVDGGGTPFGNYIVLAPEPTIQAKKTQPFSVNFTHRFFDPATYVAPAPGRYLNLPTGNSGASYLVDTTNLLSQGLTNTEFTFTGWFRSNNASATDSWLFHWLDAVGTLRGFAVAIDRNGATSSAQIQLYLGDGSAIVHADSGYATSTFSKLIQDTANFHFIAVTYKADANASGQERFRFYIDGGLIDEGYANKPGLFDFAKAIQFGSDVGTASYVGHMDGIQVFQRELSPFEIAAKYNSGAGVPGSADEDRLIAGFRFDAETVVTFRYATPVYGPGTNPALPGVFLGVNPAAGTAPTISTGSNFGPITTAESGTELRGRFLVEAQRLDDSDDGQLAAQDEATWSLIQLTTFDDFTYPGMALLAVRVPIQEQIGSGEPLVTVRVDGRLCPVWDGVDPINPSFVETWTRNPAWIAIEAASNELYGMGAFYDRNRDFSLAEFAEFAAFCDEGVYTGLERVPLSSASASNTTSADIPNGTIQFRVAAADYPDSWPGSRNPAISGYSSGIFVRMFDIASHGGAPAWITAHEGDSFEVYQIVFSVSPFEWILLCHNTVVESQSTYTPPGGTVQLEQVEPRMQFDCVFDRRNLSAWDAMLQILRSARASPLQSGSRMGVHWDRERDAVAFFGMGAIVADSFETSFVGRESRYNQETVEFWDEALDYERDEDGDEHPSLNDPTLFSAVIPRRISLEGVTRRSQVKRHILHDLNSFHLLRAGFQFELYLEAVSIRAGDVIELAHDVPGFGVSGRVPSTSPLRTEIKLDRPITIEAAHDYAILWQNSAANTREVVQVDTTATPPGTYAPGVTITMQGSGFSSTPTEEDQYSFGDVTIGQSQKVQVVKTTLDPSTMRRRVVCAVYDPEVYDDDFGTLATPPSTLLASTFDPETETPIGVVGLTATEETTTSPDGSVSIAARVAFTHHPGTYASVRQTNVYVHQGTGLQSGEADLVATLPANVTNVLVTNYHFEKDTEYTIVVQPVGKAGASTYRTYATWQPFRADGLAPTPPAITGLRAATVGDSASYAWNEDASLDRARAVELRRGGWILGLPVHSTPAQAREIPNTADWVGLPTNTDGIGACPLYARAKLGTGQYGPYGSLLANQDAPGSGRNAIEASMEDASWAGSLSGLTSTANGREYIGRTGAPWRTTDHLAPSGGGTTHTYEVTPTAFGAPELVFVQVGLEITQVRPETTLELAALGAIGSPNAMRWTPEGPTLVRGSEVANCTVALEIAYSDTATPGSDWRAFRPGRYRLRSCKFRLTITRPDTSFSFKVHRFAYRMTWQGAARVSQAVNRVLLNV